MHLRVARAYVVPALLLTGTLLLLAQDWQTVTDLNGVDMRGLSSVQKTRALHALRAEECTCGCGMKIAECRVKDPSCAFSKGLSSTLLESIKNGKSEAAAIAEMKASKYAQRP